jgi:hypothetical protein
MIPNLFYKGPLPKSIPKDMQKVINELKKSKNQMDCLKKAYKIVESKYNKTRFLVYILFWRAFWTDMDKIWNHKGYVQCNIASYLLRTLLVKSGWFKDDDIEIKHTLVWYISFHQYFKIKVGKEIINVDVHAAPFGVKLGEYAHGFKGYV